MGQIIVDIAEIQVSQNASDTLVTYSLGSCIGVAFYDPFASVGGMIHCMLPRAKLDMQKAKEHPGMFVDTGMFTALTKLTRLGLKKSRCIVYAAGCARVLHGPTLFRIGERNQALFQAFLKKNNMRTAVEDFGGEASRTVWLDMSTGCFTVRSKGEKTVYDWQASFLS